MTMTIAFDGQGQVASINDVPSGLRCACRCIECDELLIARKGPRRIHHFSHVSQKEPCEIRPESFLHRYSKWAVRDALGLQLPPLPGQFPASADPTSWWDFKSVKEEVWMGDFRPDLVAELTDGPLLIEFACTSFVNEEKLARIERTGIRAVEIDLSALKVSPTPEGLRALKNTILNDCDIKRWLYPLVPVTVETGQPASTDVSALPPGVLAASWPERIRFTIGGLWVDLRVLEFGAVVVRSVAYSPAIAELLKRLARRYSGRYVAAYKNWMFPPQVKEGLVEQLKALADKEPQRLP